MVLKKTKKGTKYSEEVVASQSLRHYYKKKQDKIRVALLCNIVLTRIKASGWGAT